jgi:hypothetical protein
LRLLLSFKQNYCVQKKHKRRRGREREREGEREKRERRERGREREEREEGERERGREREREESSFPTRLSSPLLLLPSFSSPPLSPWRDDGEGREGKEKQEWYVINKRYTCRGGEALDGSRRRELASNVIL